MVNQSRVFKTVSDLERARDSYHFYGAPDAHPSRHCFGPHLQLQFFNLAVERSPGNLSLLQSAIGENQAFLSILAQEGIGLQVLRAESKNAYSVGHGEEVQLVFPYFVPNGTFEDKTVKKAILTLFQLLQNKGVVFRTPFQHLTPFTPVKDFYLQELESAQAVARNQGRGHSSSSAASVVNVSHKFDTRYISATFLPVVDEPLNLPFSYSVRLPQLTADIDKEEGKEYPRIRIESANFYDADLQSINPPTFSAQELRDEGIDLTPFIKTSESAAAEIQRASDDLVRDITAISQAIEGALRKHDGASCSTDEPVNGSDVRAFTDSLFTMEVSLYPPRLPERVTPEDVRFRKITYFNGVAPSIFEPVQQTEIGRHANPVTLDSRTWPQTVQGQFRCLVDKFGKAATVSPHIWHTYKPCLTELASRLRSYYVLCHKAASRPSSVHTTAASSVAKEPSAPRIAGTNSQKFPQSYDALWHDRDCRTELARIRNLLQDYVKGGFWGRLLHFHLGRNHTSAVAIVLNDKSVVSSQGLLNALVRELDGRGASLNPTGSLMRRLEFIKSRCPELNIDGIKSLQETPQPRMCGF
ncbi:substrate of the Dot/Icm secretion system [Legionella geestiana]|uniref:Substrate of the Dot/Icm secretion system n=1 Tax=Legionella geestiana TaxID=45065 RepID=A0A0W0TNW5_9GAMM|nr:DUF5617 domain-containing protein [Legionella geestiana]KTC97299.1 substrate of the Dot/Icm secretion system [Legionella geestiana]QBS12427.1 hypothetical protein E4T54_06515 [Legionella geestiana]QDQ39859.1 hypothetical protein E3226_005345 [Legionella geestiana]STX55132.1 Dot/Icm secretion system substrate [Legionella geestiana]